MTGNETVNLFIFKDLNEEITNMAKNSKIAGLLLSASFAASVLMPTNMAFAQVAQQNPLIPGTCAPAATIQAALSAQKQVPVVVGNRVTTRVDRPVNIFTSDSNGSGYWLEGDQPAGVRSTTVCVKGQYNNLHLNDINSTTVPSWALMGNDTEVANRNCVATQSGLCESHDDYIKRATAGGMRVMLSSQSVQKKADGSYQNGRLITILTQIDSQLADVKATNSLGASESFAGLEKVNYTQFAGNFLRPANTTVASLNPK